MAYVRLHPEDVPAAKAILMTLETPLSGDINNVREVVEMLLGRPVLHDEWQTMRPRWERAWDHIVRG